MLAFSIYMLKNSKNFYVLAFSLYIPQKKDSGILHFEKYKKAGALKFPSKMF